MSVEDEAKALTVELDWLAAVLAARFACLGGAAATDPLAIVPPDLPPSALARHVAANGLSGADRLILALALAPHVRPALLDPMFLTNSATGRAFTEFGGCAGRGGSGFQPSGETAAFLVAGDDLAARLRLDVVVHLAGLDQADRSSAARGRAHGRSPARRRAMSCRRHPPTAHRRDV